MTAALLLRRLRAGAWLCAWLLVACAAPAPAGSPAAPAASASGGAAPTAAPAAAQPAWQPDWERTLAAARQEGKVVLSAVGNDAYRLPLVAFEKDYPDIKVEFYGLRSPEYWARVSQERLGGQYLWDLRVGGPDPQAYQARDDGALERVRPTLVLPGVVDDAAWLGGLDGLFADRDKTFIPTFFGSASPSMFVNRDLVPDGELRSARDLLDPRYRGRIALGDPRGGPGLSQLTVLLAGYGEEYVSDLLGQQGVVPTQDIRQLAEWIVRGRYAIVLGLPKYQLEEFLAEGVGRNVRALEGPLQLNSAAGGIQLMSQAPHPNAARVYVNWVLSAKTQAALSQSTAYNSRRRDVPPADPSAVLDAARLDDYIADLSEQWLPYRQRAQQLATRLLP